MFSPSFARASYKLVKHAQQIPQRRLFSTSSVPNNQVEKALQTRHTPIPGSCAVRHSEFSNLRTEEFKNHQDKYPSWEGPYAKTPSRPTMSFDQYHSTFADIASGSRLEDHEPVTLCARINSRRNAGKLVFFDISARSDSSLDLSKLQCIVSTQRLSEEALSLSKLLRRGDWVAFTGIPGKSKTGELSLVVKDLRLLSPCLDSLPERLEDPNLRFRQRATDLIVNQEQVWPIFRTRAMVLRSLREYLHQNGFMEVETPILWPQAGGASARPFETVSNAFSDDLPLSLRVAPELFLKQLVMGGMERVFELNKVFRNEGIDATHSPEFTSCEFYMAHANIDDLFPFTENLIRTIVSTVQNGNLNVVVPPANRHDVESPTESLVIDFSLPFAKLDVLEVFQNNGVVLPANYNDDSAIPELLAICKERGIKVAAPITVARILDKLIGDIVEPLCVQPTFIINHPLALCPLAKEHPVLPGVSERFELFINCKEFVNAYTELNIPSEQYQQFSSQRAKQSQTVDFDEEAHPVDTPYCEAMQVGLPPTAGWGMGIDRLVMLLASVPHIRDVILFPIMKPQTTMK